MFQGADGGGADGDDAVAIAAGAVDGFGGVLGQVEPLGMDFVLADVLAMDGAEGVEADVQGLPMRYARRGYEWPPAWHR